MKYSKSALFFCLIFINVLAIQCLSENDIPNHEEEQEEMSLKDIEIFNEMIRKIDPEFNQTFECVREKILQYKLDPFKFPIIPLILKSTAFESNLIITNFQLHGLSSFEVPDAYVNKIPFNMFVKLSFKLDNFGIIFKKYKGFIRLMDKIHLYGAGSFAANFTDFDLDVRVNLKLKKINPLAGVLVKDIKFTMNLFKTKIDITGLFNDPYMSKLISRQLSKALTGLAGQEKVRLNSLIEATANKLAEDLINPILQTMDLAEVLALSQKQLCKSTVSYINRGVDLIQSFINSNPEFDVEDYLSQVSDYYDYHLN